MEALIEQLEQRMNQLTANHAAQMNQLAANNAGQIAQLVATNTELLQKVNQLEATQAAYQPPQNVTVVEYTDIVPAYATGNDIQLDAFKVIHEFNGDKKTYRSWRTQVAKMMKQIEAHQTTPKYAAALAIVRAKITGPASDSLINNNTAHNINAIIDRLDLSYADQRPLYVIEDEMAAIRQESKSLQEFYDAINQALNMVLTKITMTHKEPAGQKSLVEVAQQKAIRTFIVGVNSNLIRTTLYGNLPDSLPKAFAIAQTVQFDSQHMRLEQTKSKSNPNFRYQTPPPNHVPKPNFNHVPQNKPPQQPTPMEVDSSGQFVQKPQQAGNAFHQMKRQREPSFQYTNKPSASFQHANKNQRVNHVDDDVYSVNENSMENNCDTDATEHQSTSSTEESIFLDE